MILVDFVGWAERKSRRKQCQSEQEALELGCSLQVSERMADLSSSFAMLGLDVGLVDFEAVHTRSALAVFAGIDPMSVPLVLELVRVCPTDSLA